MKKNKNPDICYFENKVDESSKERCIYFWVKKENFIVVIAKNLRDKTTDNFYLKSAYVITSDDDEKAFNRRYHKYLSIT